MLNNIKPQLMMALVMLGGIACIAIYKDLEPIASACAVGIVGLGKELISG